MHKLVPVSTTVLMRCHKQHQHFVQWCVINYYHYFEYVTVGGCRMRFVIFAAT